jgi:hypothetical protein
MKIGAFVDSTPHKQITTWVNAAAHRAYEDVRELLREESKSDPQWFLRGRGTRLTQLVSEIFTLKLIDASDGRWSERDFEGQQHSSIITKALSDLIGRVTAEYRRIAVAMEHKK